MRPARPGGVVPSGAVFYSRRLRDGRERLPYIKERLELSPPDGTTPPTGPNALWFGRGGV